MMLGRKCHLCSIFLPILMALLVQSLLTARPAEGLGVDASQNLSITSAMVSGPLHVEGVQLVDQNGDPIRLQGVSMHGLAWYPEYVNEDAFRTLRDDWGANLVRLPLYTAEYGGYCTGGDQAQLKQTVCRGVDAATKLGMYVIIDWHVLNDRDPRVYQSQAVAFFDEMSRTYAGNTNVIYEICNEPNGPSWADIKQYAQQVIPVIRRNDPDALIICGTPNWSQDVDAVASDPLPYDNVMYALHFYAATHKDGLRDKAQHALNAGTPIFISESSICDASGTGNVDYASAEEWCKLIATRNLSFVEWALCNKDESASIVKSSCSALSGWPEEQLTETGRWYRTLMRQLKSATTPFVDVMPGDEQNHASEAIWLYQQGVSTGWLMSDGTREYRGLQPVARQDMAAFLHRLAGVSGIADATAHAAGGVPSFTDPAPDDAVNHGEDVAWLADENIASGFPDGRFGGTRPVSRCDMAAFLYRLADIADDGARNNSIALAAGDLETQLSKISDVGMDTDHAAEVAWLASTGITKGWDNHDGTFSFHPYATVARQDMAAFLQRTYVLLNESQSGQKAE